MNTESYVCLLMNQADMKHEQWLTRAEDVSEIIHVSSRSKNSYGGGGGDCCLFKLFRKDDHSPWLAQLWSSLYWKNSLNQFKYQYRRINWAATVRHLTSTCYITNIKKHCIKINECGQNKDLVSRNIFCLVLISHKRK